MANIFESAFMTLKNGMTMYFADSKARQLIDKLKALVDTKYGPDNPPPSTAGKIWYATCSTASGTGAKVATSSTGDFVLATGSMARVKFTTSNTAANPTISIDGSTAKTIQPKSGTSGMANLIAAGEVVDLVYDGTNFIMTKGSSATTTFYGITKLNSATNSTSTTEAATPSAVKSAYDLADGKVSKAGDTMTGNLNSSGSLQMNFRHVNGNSTDYDGSLYLNYHRNAPIYVGKNGAHNISADGSQYTGNAATATKATKDEDGKSIKKAMLAYSIPAMLARLPLSPLTTSPHPATVLAWSIPPPIIPLALRTGFMPSVLPTPKV